ncbi:MAG: radical SAM family heme chaperone HemW [Verrucomicrobiota bacterium]
MTGLYLHIPFCVSKCSYCDFYSLATEGKTETDQPDFMTALETEVAGLPDSFRPETVFIGGGTPTELSDRDFGRLLTMIPERVDVSGVIEWTCESNPGTLSPSKIDRMKEAGVNRVSLGVQTFDPETLKFLGRIHNPEEAIEGYRMLREAGLSNLNLDIIYGTPGAPDDQHLRDVHQILELGPDHTSFYCLMYEEGTTMTKLKNLGRIQPLSDERLREQHDAMRSALTENGYEQYELSNFARPGRTCRHNLLYWNGDDYFGCGPAAHSHWQGRRFSNVRNLTKYTHALLHGASPVDFEETLEPEAKARETFITNLRKVEGIARSDFKQRTGFELDEIYHGDIERFVELGFLETEDDRVRLSPEGHFVSDTIFADLI